MRELEERSAKEEKSLREAKEKIDAAKNHRLKKNEIIEIFQKFDPVWESLDTVEKCRVLHLLIERIAYDGAQGKVTINFRETGLKCLVEEQT